MGALWSSPGRRGSIIKDLGERPRNAIIRHIATVSAGKEGYEQQKAPIFLDRVSILMGAVTVLF
jgi:hypothetical protein